MRARSCLAVLAIALPAGLFGCGALLGIENVYEQSDGGPDAGSSSDGTLGDAADGRSAETSPLDTSSPDAPLADAPVVDAPSADSAPFDALSPDAEPCGGRCDGATCFEGVCGGDRIVQVGAGTGFGCALTKAGSVWCWGAGNNGQLGNNLEGDTCLSLIGGVGTVPCTWMAEEIPGLHDVVQIGTGDSACAVESDNSVWCWGWNNNGVLGHVPGTSGDTFFSSGNFWYNATPTIVRSDDGGTLASKAISTIGIGNPCVVTTSGNVACWGDNTDGQLGNGSIGGSTSSPSIIPNFSDVVKVSVGGPTACALKTDGSVWCWGFENAGFGHDPGGGTPFQDVACTYPLTGETGFCELNPTLVYQADNATPQFGSDVDAGALRATDIAVGDETACAIAAGDVWCWGGYRVLRRPGPNPDVFPSKLISGAHATGISMSFSHGVAAQAGGGAIAWGGDEFGELGIGFTENDAGGPCAICVPPTPVDVDGGVVQVAAGWELSLLLKRDGTVWASGLNDTARLGHPYGQDGDRTCTALGQTSECNPTPSQVALP